MPFIESPFAQNGPLDSHTTWIRFSGALQSKLIKNAGDGYWSELKQQLQYLVTHDVIVCPVGILHEEESRFSGALRDQLKAIFRELAGATSFRLPEEVQLSQLSRSLRAFLKCTASHPTLIKRAEGFTEDPNQWSEYFEVHVDLDSLLDDVLTQRLRDDKEAAHKRMKRRCETWKENKWSFDEHAARESNILAECCVAYRTLTDGAIDTFCPFSAPSGLVVVDKLVREMLVIDPDEGDPIRRIEEFAKSESYLETPCISLSSLLWAKIGELVRSAAGGRKPKASDPYDVAAISTYAPYCDAMFIDNGFRSAASDGRIACEHRYPVRLFSENSRDGFLQYLRDIEASIPADHWKVLRFIRGDDGDSSYPK